MIKKLLLFIRKLRYERPDSRNTITRNSRQIVKALSKHIGERSLGQYSNLLHSQLFLQTAFTLHGGRPYLESYRVDGKEVANIIVDFEGKKKSDEILLVGAHYDTVSGTIGANDNASGIAALLEIHRIFSKLKIKCRRTVRFVAFVLEEPPHFGTDEMGSRVHAKAAKEKGEDIRMMLSLDMLGYGGRFIKQRYPLEYMSRKYPKKGDFIAAVSVPSQERYVKLVKRIYNKHSARPMRELVAPASVNGIDNSDHASFLQHGFPAIMVTDTGFYRNEDYHTLADDFTKINYPFLGYNIQALAKTIADLADRRTL